MLLIVPVLLTLALDPAPPEPAPKPKGPVVVLDTSLGRIKIALDKEKAPISVDNFLKYVRAQHYDGTIFHRVIARFMIQGGGHTPDLVERPTRPGGIKNESKNGLSNRRGTIAMARLDDPDSASAQFFINLKDNLGLDYSPRGAGYAVFGQVVEGMEVVDRIAAVPTATKGHHEAVPRTPVLIKTAREAPATR